MATSRAPDARADHESLIGRDAGRCSEKRMPVLTCKFLWQVTLTTSQRALNCPFYCTSFRRARTNEHSGIGVCACAHARAGEPEVFGLSEDEFITGTQLCYVGPTLLYFPLVGTLDCRSMGDVTATVFCCMRMTWALFTNQMFTHYGASIYLPVALQPYVGPWPLF
jgi:hypothetical protein